MNLARINCLGCGAPVSGEYKLCSRCCQLLVVHSPSEVHTQESASKDLKESDLTDVLPHADKDFALSFYLLSLSSGLVLGWLALIRIAPMGLKLSPLMECLR